MRTSQTVCTRVGKPVMQRPLVLAMTLALGSIPLAGSASSLISVTTAGDLGTSETCTVRQAIVALNTHSIASTNCANVPAANDTINFDPTTFPNGAANIIALLDSGSSTLEVTDPNLTIDASANGTVTIQRPPGAANLFGILYDSAASGSLTLKNLILKNGEGGACGVNGGGICSPHASLTLNNCTLSDNSAAGKGGGIWAANTSVTLTNSTLSGNSAGGRGGGIYAAYGGVTLTHTTLSGNSASDGGGVASFLGGLTLTNSTLSGNSGGAGSGILSLSSNTTLVNSTLNANTGGGIFSNSSTVTVTNSTFSGNGGTAITGGFGDSISVFNSTISANSYGMTCQVFFQVVNSIVAGNGGDLNPICLKSSSGNLIGGNPQLGALADNGGLTSTMLPLPGSPAIDAISCTNLPATDQRGVARPQGAQCDIGSVEVGQPFALTVDTTADIDVVDGKCSLREAVNIFTHGRALASDCPPGASAGNRIVFAPALAGSSIVLASQLVLDSNVEVTIDGSGAPGVAIDGNNAMSIFNISSGSAVTMQHLSMVNGNSAGSDGGAITNSGTLTLAYAVLSNNSSNSGGGAITSSATLNVDHSTLSNNITLGSGGALDVQDGVSTVTNSTVVDNLAAGGGGVFVAANGTLNLTGDNVSTNHALSANGGGVNGSGYLTIANSTFSANTASADGGAIFNDKAATINKIVNSTLAGNTAVHGGNLANAAGTLLLQNSIVANGITGNNCNGTITPGTGFLTWPASDTTCGAFTLANPVLGPLQNNGGSTFTMLPGAGSAALDAGNAATCAAAPVNNRDQRGVLRPQGSTCDIGAVEVVVGRIFADNFDGTPST